MSSETAQANTGRDRTACLCGNDRGRPLLLETAVSRPHGQGQVVQCPACGLRFVAPRPTHAELRAYYAGEFEETYRRVGMDYIGGREAPPPHLRQRLASLERRLGRPAVLLEVGAGAGAFAGYAKDRGWQVIGTEVSEAAAKRVRDRYGVDMRVGEIGDLDVPADSVDVVHMNHVLEHVLDPRRTLTHARNLLRPGGILVVEVPHEFADLVYWIRRSVGRIRPYHVRSPHLWFFTPPTLRRLLEDVGFDIVSLDTPRRASEERSVLLRIVKRTVVLFERPAHRGPLIVVLGRKHG
jgi:SAM-dependent methyltransferase